MKVVAKIIIDIGKLDELKKKLEAAVSTVDGSAPQINKNRRIKSLMSMVENLITDLITVDYKEVSNG
jgi:hypothetical protein